MPLFLVAVEHPTPPMTVVAPVVRDEFEVEAPGILEACYAVLDGRDKGKPGVTRRRTHDPYTRTYHPHEADRYAGAVAILRDDERSVANAVVHAGQDFAALHESLIRKVATAVAERDADNLISAIVDVGADPATMTKDLREYFETEWFDEERPGRPYHHDLYLALATHHVTSEEDLCTAREAYWDRTREAVAKWANERPESDGPTLSMGR